MLVWLADFWFQWCIKYCLCEFCKVNEVIDKNKMLKASLLFRFLQGETHKLVLISIIDNVLEALVIIGL